MSQTTPPLEGLLAFEEAERILTKSLAPVKESAPLSLRLAGGRILAEDMISPHDLPPFDNAAVDGFALRHYDMECDMKNGMDDYVLHENGAPHCAGDQPPIIAQEKIALRIMTGAQMPQGYDCVIPQELCKVINNHVTIPWVPQGSNRRLRGEDIKKGATIISSGIRLKPHDIAHLAAAGFDTIPIYRKVKVAVFSTGNELQEAGHPLDDSAKIYDANRHGLIAILDHWGADISDLGILKDEAKQTWDILKEQEAQHDLLLTSGGISTGMSDHVSGVLQNNIAFWRLAIKPGRPIGFGFVGKTPLLALPGNPVASLVTAMTLVRLAFFLIGGRHHDDRALIPFKINAAHAIKKKKGRREFRRAIRTHEGRLKSFAKTGAGILSSLTQSDGLIILDEEQENLDEDTPLSFIPMSAYLW